MSITKSHFFNNRAHRYDLEALPTLTTDGILLHASHDSPSDTTFATLSSSGGALRLSVAVLWVDGSSFHSNFASNVGGAIFFMQSCIQVRRSCLVMQITI